MYSITSLKNWQKYIETGNNDYLNDLSIRSLKSGDKIVLSSEGEEIEIEVK